MRRRPAGPRAGAGSRLPALTTGALALLATLALAAAAAAPGAAAARRGNASLSGLQIGFAGPELTSSDAGTREYWLRRTAATGASLIRVGASWAAIAPKSPPAGFEAANPASPGYDWAKLDAALRSAASAGLRVMLNVNGAPAWAEGAGRPAGIRAGAWKPQAPAFGAFARAIAARYSGSFPDPLSPGSALPRVRYFEVWNEPNLDTYLAPQWEGWRSRGPAIYRKLLNSFYAGAKAAQPGATVIGGSLAPFGDRPGGERTPPVEFLRRLLCLRGGALRPVACPHPARLDVLSDHPIAVGAPLESARSPLDVTTPNLGRLTRVMERAEATGRVLPRGHKPLWVTEFWYDSNPPDPNGVPLYREARWYEQDLYLFWKQGARVAITLQIRDSPPGKGWEYTNQSGVFFLDGTPKPARTAFRFPFVAQRTGRRAVSAWGISPRRGRVRIEVRRGGRWTTLTTVRAAAWRATFATTLPLRGRAHLRAVVGGEASLPWTLG